MKVQIDFIPRTTTNIEYAKQVKDISKDLMEICKKCGVCELNFNHDYFKIKICCINIKTDF